MSGTPNPYRHQYEVVPASSTTVVLGNTGAIGDFLHRCIVNVTAASGGYQLTDGTTPVGTSVTLTTGVYNLEYNMASQNGAWKVTTGAGVTVIGIGTFTN